MHCKLCHSQAAERYDLGQFRVMRCGTCGLIFLDGVIGEGQVQDLYSEDYFRERQEYFFGNAIADPEHGKVTDTIHDFTRGLRTLKTLVPQGRRLLDFGCGVGIFLNMAKQDGWHVTGVELSPFASRYARESFGLDVFQGPLRDAKFPDETFDVVTMWDTFEHVEDPLSELKEVRRVLRKGGVVLVDTPNGESLLRVLADALYMMSFGTFRYPLNKLYHVYHLYYFSPSTLTRVVESAGLRVLHMEKKPIPISKARGSMAEKAIVKALSGVEKILGREYEIFLVAQKP